MNLKRKADGFLEAITRISKSQLCPGAKGSVVKSFRSGYME